MKGIQSSIEDKTQSLFTDKSKYVDKSLLDVLKDPLVKDQDSKNNVVKSSLKKELSNRKAQNKVNGRKVRIFKCKTITTKVTTKSTKDVFK